MSNVSRHTTNSGGLPSLASQENPWPTFEQILNRLHREGIYLHPEQLAAFFLWHGLPVDLRYVPPHLKQRAHRINSHYQGDMARLESLEVDPWYSSSLR